MPGPNIRRRRPRPPGHGQSVQSTKRDLGPVRYRTQREAADAETRPPKRRRSAGRHRLASANVDKVPNAVSTRPPAKRPVPQTSPASPHHHRPPGPHLRRQGQVRKHVAPPPPPPRDRNADSFRPASYLLQMRISSTPPRERLTQQRLKFHADKLSSAHVYLRMRDGQSWDALPPPLVMDLAQLTKANSIEGNKRDNVTVVYTPWSNLRKDGSMDTGQVSFKDARKVRRVLVPARDNAVVNRLNKTRVEKRPDLKRDRDDRLQVLRRREQDALQARTGVPGTSKELTNPRLLHGQRKEEARQAQDWKEKKWAKDHAYDDMFSEENMAASSNQDRDANWEDDFM
ncbi:uncharacterized protein MAM_05218 [Metarhizium album ARSEF 1941]|uniref:NFACT RNA-binding domain-containing protein n=1 Tax=Metarhizium album (strain ARSEF 1941) TaxID=1081103 RepID=A0A0B2WTY1_METAS|nr:uncharacterized protein MAM_05218 [Metarhizium album ARSEF 1941]KHN97109.1 hypothetical protein MAM_05218 [Metarhizium album ARSEF 1941]